MRRCVAWKGASRRVYWERMGLLQGTVMCSQRESMLQGASIKYFQGPIAGDMTENGWPIWTSVGPALPWNPPFSSTFWYALFGKWQGSKVTSRRGWAEAQACKWSCYFRCWMLHGPFCKSEVQISTHVMGSAPLAMMQLQCCGKGLYSSKVCRILKYRLGYIFPRAYKYPCSPLDGKSAMFLSQREWFNIFTFVKVVKCMWCFFRMLKCLLQFAHVSAWFEEKTSFSLKKQRANAYYKAWNRFFKLCSNFASCVVHLYSTFQNWGAVFVSITDFWSLLIWN
jgi:hypothetical protein